MSQFFSLDGPLMSALERIANLALINILWLLCSIFILPLGPATEAMCYCTMKVLKNEDSHVIRMFFRELKDNFLKKMLAGLILLLVGAGLYFQFQLVFDWQSDLSSNVKIIAGVPMATVALIYLFPAILLFPLCATFENSMKQTLLNSFLIGIKNLFFVLLMAIIQALPAIVFYFQPDFFWKTMILWLGFGVSGPYFFNAIIVRHILKPYMPAEDANEFLEDFANETGEDSDNLDED